MQSLEELFGLNTTIILFMIVLTIVAAIFFIQLDAADRISKMNKVPAAQDLPNDTVLTAVEMFNESLKGSFAFSYGGKILDADNSSLTDFKSTFGFEAYCVTGKDSTGAVYTVRRCP